MQIIVAERGPLVFVFNFSPFNDYEGYKVCPLQHHPHMPAVTACASAGVVHSFASSLSMRWHVRGLQVGTMEAGKFRAVLSSDDAAFGGQGRINSATEHFTHPEGTPGSVY
jgi:1,4-alpha-glucan branching enzyme